MELECKLFWQYGRARVLAGDGDAGEKYARKALEPEGRGFPFYRFKLLLKAAVFRKMMEYDWPGNIRELKHAVESAVYFRGDATWVIGADVLGSAETYSSSEHESLSRVSDHAVTEIYLAVKDEGYEPVLERLEKQVLENPLSDILIRLPLRSAHRRSAGRKA